MARLRGLLPLPPSRDVQPFGDWCFAVPDALVEGYIVSLVKRVLLTPLFLSQILNPAQCLSSRKMSCFIHRFIAAQDYKICLEATYAFEDEGYRTISQAILEHFLESDAASLHSINRLFHENRLDLKRDEHFISQILKSRGDFDTINAFIDFIKKQDGELSGFAENIKTAVESVDEGERTWQKYRIEDGLVHAVIRLIDSANGDNELTECCLDILDEIYRKRILTDSAISKLLEGAE